MSLEFPARVSRFIIEPDRTSEGRIFFNLPSYSSLMPEDARRLADEIYRVADRVDPEDL